MLDNLQAILDTVRERETMLAVLKIVAGIGLVGLVLFGLVIAVASLVIFMAHSVKDWL